MAWQIALKCHEEGAVFTLSNAPIALRMGKINELSTQCGNALVIGADATSIEDLENVFTKSIEQLGGKIDFVLHSIGMSPNVRKKFLILKQTTKISKRLLIFLLFHFIK